MNSLNIVFAGTPEFAIPSLDALAHSNHLIKAVYTQPDRPAGRGRKLQPSAVKNWAEAQSIPVFQPLNFKNSDTVDELAALKPDVMVVIAYGLILPKKVLAIPRLGCINVHASLLPRWRGASPIQHSILFGDPISGVTIMQMDAGMDTGDILSTVSYEILPHETAGTLHDQLALLGADPLIKTLNALVAGNVQPQPQSQLAIEATYAGKISKEDGAIIWDKPAKEIDCQIRAYNPWPIAYTSVNNELMRIYEAKIEPETHSATPGTVLSITKEGLLVAAGDEVLRIQRIQFAGGKVISIADWLNSGRTQLTVNMVLK